MPPPTSNRGTLQSLCSVCPCSPTTLLVGFFARSSTFPLWVLLAFLSKASLFNSFRDHALCLLSASFKTAINSLFELQTKLGRTMFKAMGLSQIDVFVQEGKSTKEIQLD